MALLGLDTPLKRAIFGTYIGLWVSVHLLIYRSKRDGSPPYNSTSAVLVTELVKLTLAIGMYLAHDGTLLQLARATAAAMGLLLRYSVPALLYCVVNNLMFANLSYFDPGTYNVLSQLRIVLTGLLYQVLFSKRLSRSQWLSIALIAVGCVTKESSKLGASPVARGAAASAWLLLLAQMLASVFAGVYNEVLLKGSAGSAAVPTNLQNAFLYLSSVGWNLLFLVSKGALREALAPENVSALLTPNLLAVIAIMSTVGMVTGFFLKHLDSVLKAIASALDVIFCTVLSALFFSTPLDPQADAPCLLPRRAAHCPPRPPTSIRACCRRSSPLSSSASASPFTRERHVAPPHRAPARARPSRAPSPTSRGSRSSRAGLVPMAPAPACTSCSRPGRPPPGISAFFALR